MTTNSRLPEEFILATSSSKQSRASTGTVVKVGPGKMAGDGTPLPMDVTIGEKVKFVDFAGNNVEIEGEEYSVVKIAEVLAKVLGTKVVSGSY